MSGGTDSGRVIDGVKRAGLPLLMVQGTEDALIGSPLALVLKQEVETFIRQVQLFGCSC